MAARRRGNAFTLVELLVVIAIIAVLIGILLPALARARYQAQLATCAARLQQLSAAMHLYANDNKKGYLPRQDLLNTGANLWDVSNDFYNSMRQKYRLPHPMLFCPLSTGTVADFTYNYFGTFTIVGYCVWVPRRNGVNLIPPEPGAAPFTYPTNYQRVSIRGPTRVGEKLANANPILTDIMAYTAGPVPAATDTIDMEKFRTAINWNAVSHFWRSRPDSINAAYADGHVERILTHAIRARYFGNYWIWR